MDSIFEKIFIGAIGGLVAYWFAHRKFVTQQSWDKRFNLYIEAIEVLKQIEHSLSIYEWAIENGETIDSSETVKSAYLEFEDGLSKLHGLQSKLILIDLNSAHQKLMILSSGLQAVHPSYLTSDSKENKSELIDLIKQSKRMVGGCSGEIAFEGKDNLGIGSNYIKKIKSMLGSNS